MSSVWHILEDRKCGRTLEMFESLRKDLGASKDPVGLLAPLCDKLGPLLADMRNRCLATFKGGPNKASALDAAASIAGVCRRTRMGILGVEDVMNLAGAMDSLIAFFPIGGVGYKGSPK